MPNNYQQRFVKVCVLGRQGTTTTHFRQAGPPLANPDVVALLHTGSDFFNATDNNNNNTCSTNMRNKFVIDL